jgi:PST family polysaccharide transporter
MKSGRHLAFGTVVMSAGNVLKAVLQLLLLPIMARLLGPGEFGLYALAMPAIQLLLMLADGGLGQSLAREPEDNWRVWSSAFWLLLLSSVVLGLLAIGVSFILAAVTAEPRLPPIMAALSGCIVIFIIAIPSNARLLRQGRMEVGPLADVLATAVGATVAVIMAIHGFGAWSLVGQTVALFTVRTVIAVLIAPVIPRLYFSFDGLRGHLAMGGAVVGTKLVDTGDRIVENSVIGRFFGSAVLGSFSFAIQITRFACESLSNALWSALYIRSLHSPSLDATHRDYLRMVRIVAVLLFPAAFIGAGTADHLVVQFLGAKWAGAVPLIRFCLPTYALCVAGSLGSAVLYAGGRSAIQLQVATEGGVMRSLGAVATYWTGMTGFGVWLAVANLYVGARSVHVTCKYLGSDPRSVYAPAIMPLVCSVIVGAIAFCLERLIGLDLLRTGLVIATSLLLYAGLLAVTDRTAFRQDFSEVAKLLQKRKQMEP